MACSQDLALRARSRATVGAMTARGVLLSWWLVLASSPACSDKARTVEIPNAPMVEVPAGTFLMGCVPMEGRECRGEEMPAREIYVSAFAIDRTEVTVAAYRRCQEAKVCGKPLPRDDSDPNYAITGVTWFDADRYCRWVGRRLPTEAEWEKAARGTDGRSFPWGEQEPDCTLAQYRPPHPKASCGNDWVAPVDAHPRGAAPSGALDMAGNAPEWTADWYHYSYYNFGPRKDPTGDASDRTGHGRAVRGRLDRYDLEIYHRIGSLPTTNGGYGFRCARSLTQTP
jgi:formylglycine-generating enzyme required for sulfatase activity